MKGSPKFQWMAFALPSAILAAVIGFMAASAWRHLNELRRQLSTLQAESFHVADHLEAMILDLNETVLRLNAHGSAAEVEQFRRKAGELEDWIEKQTPHVNTPRERQLLQEIHRAFKNYRDQVNPWLESGGHGISTPLPPLLDTLERESALYLRLLKQFDEAQQWSLGQFGQESHRSTVLLQRLLSGAVLLLLALWILVATLLYRALIAPLRAKLLETRGILERQEKLASLGTLAAGVAHEIRNPLTAIKVRLHSLKKMLSDGSSEHEDAVVIGSEILRLERIVKDFLLFARPSEPQFVATTADAMLQHVHALLAGQVASAGAALKLEPSPELRVLADPQQLEQVLINLVQNAAESLDQRGTITLKAFPTRANLGGRPASAVALEVSDTGKGIPPDVQRRLFDPFFTTKPAGTGLGLSIAARIVERHGGTLQYRTELNKGTVFRVLLPAIEKDENERTIDRR